MCLLSLIELSDRSLKTDTDKRHDDEIQYCLYRGKLKQESPAIADKPARRESLPKIAPIRRAYNVVADDTGLSSCV